MDVRERLQQIIERAISQDKVVDVSKMSSTGLGCRLIPAPPAETMIEDESYPLVSDNIEHLELARQVLNS